MVTRVSPRRELGRTGFVATRLGLGDLADASLPFETLVATLRRGLDSGLNLVDTAPSYEDGLSERVVGAALAGRRDGVFLIDKIDHFDRAVAPQIEGSLARLDFSSVDLFVFHGVSELERYRAITAPGGRLAELEVAREAGKCRFVGFSSHDPDVLEAAILDGRSDVLLFPIGPFVDTRYVDRILPLCRARGIGSVCFKTFGAGKLLGDTSGYNRPLVDRPRGKLSSGGGRAPEPVLPHLDVESCVRFTLTLDPDVALLGMSFPNEQDAALDAAETFEPLSRAELDAVRTRAALAMQQKGACWWNPPEPTQSDA